MIGHTILSFSFASNGEHQFELRIWITETQTSNLLGIEFYRQYVLKLHFETPEIKLKKKRRRLSVAVICVQQNPILLSRRHALSERPIRSILTPKPPEFGNIHRKIDQKTSHQ